MNLQRVVCILLALGLLCPTVLAPSVTSATESHANENKIRKLEKEPWMKPFLKVKHRNA
jgi:hypothetical protein